MHTDNDTQSHVQYMYSTHVDIFPPSRGALLMFCQLRGGGSTYVSQMQQQLQMDGIPAYSNGLSRERYISPSPGSLFCVCRRNYGNISLSGWDWLEWGKLWSHDARYWFGLKFSVRWYATKFRWLLPASRSLISVTLLSRFSQSHYLRRKWHHR